MRTPTPPARRRHRSGESGMAMVVAIMVIAVLTLVAVLATQLSFHDQSTTRVDRKRTQSIAAAEAGLDLALEQVSQATLPCTLTGTLPTSPTTSSYTVTINYYDTYPVAGAALACDPANGPVAVPKAAEITSKGTTAATNYGDRSMQSLAKLTAIPANGLNKAIFANGNLTFNNNAAVNGQVGNDGDVYTNKDFVCANSMTIHGSLYTQGGASLSNSCTIAVDLWAKNAIGMSNSVNIGHDAKSSRSNITITHPNARVNHDAIAGGTVSTVSGNNVGNAISQNATVPDPPFYSFPKFYSPSFDPTVGPAWVAAGYTVLPPNNTCSGATSIYNQVAAMSTATVPTVLQTTCPMQWSNNTTITLNRDVVIYSSGGFAPSNRFDVKSTVAGTQRMMYWFVPSDSLTMPCTNPSITTTNLTRFTDVAVFMYTPCNVSVNNNTGSTGQVYGGSDVTIANLFTLTFFPLPQFAASGADGPPVGYKVDTVYKREVKNS
ncbi:MAG TPA: pilus assembly PilX N-terminal domain-containing protein [Miltoncostaeaceae bacterium]|nr:pilus assembly PilX N-terminal domain-containing protein [Miltoncostaeaceae bacterium]